MKLQGLAYKEGVAGILCRTRRLATEMTYDLIVIGGGPAGSSAAITAARAGRRVLLLERGRFPRHKVCGEFISPEATGLLHSLIGPAADSLLAHAPRIPRARLFIDGRTLEAPLAEPALSLPRYQLDEALWRAALTAGADCRAECSADRVEDDFVWLGAGDSPVHGEKLINASGRWSNLTRTVLAPDAPRFLGLKAHFREAQPALSCDLYFFRGGYCGVQPIGSSAVNACAMVRSDCASTPDQVFARHQELWRRSRDWEPITEPVSTAPLVFRPPEPVSESNVLRVGDAAGVIASLAGDGIAIALASGTAAAHCCLAGEGAEAYQQNFARRAARPIAIAEALRKFAAKGKRRRLMMGLAGVPGLAKAAARLTRIG